MNKSVINIKPLGFPWETQDPFLFCAFHKDDYPKGNGQLGPATSLEGRNLGSDFAGKDGFSMYHGQTVPGFPGHPHRGFETITIAEKGMVDHSDSLGAAGRFGDGDVQWMTAGKGVQHSEMFPLLKEDEANPLVLFQIWLNLPQKNKMVDPHFAMLWKENIQVHTHSDENGNKTTVDVISGKLGDIDQDSPAPDSWAANPYNDVAVWTIQMAPNAEWTIPAGSASSNRSLYFYEGNTMEIEGQAANAGHQIMLNAGEETTIVNGDAPSRLLMLHGKPIQEPVAKHGPFVMNTNQEIHEAIKDYQNTFFGGWPWPTHEHTHEKDRGRFALHADGTLESPH
jgi:redox-sensitive bicupin YhaK (pirin superfamily)